MRGIRLTSEFLSLFKKCSATWTGRMLARSFLLYASKCSMSSFSSASTKPLPVSQRKSYSPGCSSPKRSNPITCSLQFPEEVEAVRGLRVQRVDHEDHHHAEQHDQRQVAGRQQRHPPETASTSVISAFYWIFAHNVRFFF